MITENINTSVLSNVQPQKIVVVQNDSGRIIKANIVDFKIPEAATARVWVIKPDKKVVWNDCDIITDSVVQIELTTQMLAAVGLAKAKIEIYDDNKVLSTFNFYLQIEEDISDPNGTESQNESTALQAIENTLREYEIQLKADLLSIENKTNDGINAIAEITNAKIGDINNTASAQMAGIDSLVVAKMGDIDSLTNAKIGDINNTATAQINSVNNAAIASQRNAIAAVESQKQTAISTVITTTNAKLSDINNTALSQIDAINTTAQAQSQALKNQTNEIYNLLGIKVEELTGKTSTSGVLYKGYTIPKEDYYYIRLDSMLINGAEVELDDTTFLIVISSQNEDGSGLTNGTHIKELGTLITLPTDLTYKYLTFKPRSATAGQICDYKFTLFKKDSIMVNQ